MNKNDGEALLYNLLKLRMVEEYLADVYPSDVIKCPVHLSIGSEAVSVGVCGALKKTDFVIGGHRGHGLYLAKGAPLNEFMAEMYGKTTGCCGGKGGSMHLVAPEFGVIGTTPILGATIPIGVGIALASKIKKKDDVTVVFFGDGACEEGAFYESMNLAALRKLPVIFACENNGYSIFQTIEQRQPLDNIYQRGESFGIEGKRIDGTDVLKVYEATVDAVKCARRNEPVLLEFITYRWRQHVGPYYDYEIGFGEKDEMTHIMNTKDPIKIFTSHGIKHKLFSAEFVNKITKKVEREISKALDFVNASSLPDPKELYTNLY